LIPKTLSPKASAPSRHHLLRSIPEEELMDEEGLERILKAEEEYRKGE
jgi:hypothetical protein